MGPEDSLRNLHRPAICFSPDLNHSSAHTLPSYLLKIFINIIFSYRPVSSKLSLVFVSLKQNRVCITYVFTSSHATWPAYHILLEMIYHMMFEDKYKPCSFFFHYITLTMIQQTSSCSGLLSVYKLWKYESQRNRLRLKSILL
jgi:hypothetical protein